MIKLKSITTIRGALLLSALILLASCSHKKDYFPLLGGDEPGPGIDYRQEMRTFVQGTSTYARSKSPGFIIIPQNGIELITDTGETTGTPVAAYIDAINGVGQEDLHYGYTGDNIATPAEDTTYLGGYLDIAESNGIQVLAIDYCSTPSYMDASYAASDAKGYMGFAADHRELDNIPPYPAVPHNENTNDITTLAGAQNFLYLINPSEFATKEEMLTAMQNTNYDVIVMDLFFNDGTPLSSADIASLKVKNNGYTRLVICYLSIGEAENYRYYWQSEWRRGNPDWLWKQNPDWPGNYKVWYWEPAWQAIIYGDTQTNGHNSYLKQIIDAGFDGVYLDIIDAFWYWEER